MISFSFVAVAQDQHPPQDHTVVPQVELMLPSSPMRTDLPRGGGIFGEMSCDRNGAIYIRPEHGNPQDTLALTAAVVRINSDGTVSRFQANQENGTVAPHVMADAIDADGHVFLLTMRPGAGEHLSVLQLSPDSSFVSKTDLDRELTPNLFTALPSGDFLVGGTVKETDRNKPEAQPTTKSVLWLFGSDGQFKREFLSSAPPAETEPADKSAKKKPAKRRDTTPVSFTSVQVGDDGNIYVLDPGTAPRVFVFDQDGKKVRTLKLQPPQGSANRKLYISNGRLMVQYWMMVMGEDGKRTGKRVFRVYDSQTGLPMADYMATFQGVPACMDNNDLLFIVTTSEGIGVARASLR